MDFEERISRLKEIIDESDRVVFFGGAGVSTESGVPDFRSKDGLYNQHDVRFDRYSPEYLLSHTCLVREPKVFFEFYRQKLDCRNIEPNIVHKKLAELEEKGKLTAVITQNIDGLHQKAGSRNVYELHGTTERNYCSRCGRSYPADYIFKCTEDMPYCEEPGCGGTVRPDVTLYEESLPDEAWNRSMAALSTADTLIIGGTSMVVYPAAGLVHYFRGRHIVIINRDALDYDRNAELVFHENLGEVFSRL